MEVHRKKMKMTMMKRHQGLEGIEAEVGEVGPVMVLRGRGDATRCQIFWTYSWMGRSLLK